MSAVSPYINTKLYTIISLLPQQMDNNLYVNLKNNLQRTLQGKCFKDFGFIDEIYEVIDYTNNIIYAENFSAASTFDVTFSCRLCFPLKNSLILGKIAAYTSTSILLINGPILVIVNNDSINEKNFFTDTTGIIRYKNIAGAPHLKIEELLKVRIINSTLHHGDTDIYAIGYIEDVGTEEEKSVFYDDMHKLPAQAMDINKYLASDDM